MVTQSKTEIKPTAPSTAQSLSKNDSESEKSKPTNVLLPSEKFKSSLLELENERTRLIKLTVENLDPSKPFDSGVLREIQKIETRKNRLIVGWFAAMLKKNEPGIAPIVHQIIEI